MYTVEKKRKKKEKKKKGSFFVLLKYNNEMKYLQSPLSPPTVTYLLLFSCGMESK